MLLNVAVFIWFGAICPWDSFAHNNIIPLYRLIFLGILVLLLRRPPIIFAMHKKIHQIEDVRQAGFVGFFGPIGVSAIFYLYVSLDFLRNITVDGEVREDARTLMEAMNIVVWFLAICSIVIHGLSIPLWKLGFYLPRTVSAAVSQRGEYEPFHIIREHATEGEHALAAPSRNQSGAVTPNSGIVGPLPKHFRIGRTESRSTTPTPVDSPTGTRTLVTVSQTTLNSQSHSTLDSPRPESF